MVKHGIVATFMILLEHVFYRLKRFSLFSYANFRITEDEKFLLF